MPPPLALVRVLLVAVLGLAAVARATLITLHTPDTPVRAGSAVAAEIIVINPAAHAVQFALGTEFDGRLSDGVRTWSVNVVAAAADVSVPAGGFQRVPVTLALPGDVRGRVVLELNVPAAVRGVLDVSAEAPGSMRHAPHTPADLAGGEVVSVPAATLPAASRLKRYYASHFSAHEPMYFLGGGEAPAVKFQLSMKYRLLNDTGPLARRFPASRGLHVGYTQRSLWDITSVSSPFFDSSYMPEVLFESLAPDTGNRTGFTWIGWQAGAQHESNGRDGAFSRSLNTLYFRPMFVLGDLDGWRLIVRPKFLVYVGDLSDNRSIPDYRGYGELRAIVGQANRLSVSFTARIGDDFRKGSLQVDASYPTEFMSGNFAMYLMAQYWTGYGESLLRFDQRSEAFRAGISLAR